jgi:deoxyribodipyrimidine photo-lyase
VARADTLPPGRDAALARIARVQPADYARTRNHLEGAVTGLSPYLTHGVVTLRDVLAGVLEREPLAIGHKLVFELGWREFFRHVWAHAGDDILNSLHPGPLPDHAYDPVLPPDIREAHTGVPVIDEAVRTLYATGTLHNHARMWLASYVVHLRRVHWRAGADWMVAHLLDGDLASNHLSWQWVAGTGSHKPYLFDAQNVARYAPAHWHSPGTVIDQSYEALERIARGASRPQDRARTSEPTTEPPLRSAPPTDLGVHAPDTTPAAHWQGRTVWLVHPWALRAPPADLPPDTEVIGVYLREHHVAWPWPEARWRWVDAAMAAWAPRRWFVDAAGLAAALAGATQVRAVADSHITRWLAPFVQLDPAPTLFPPVERPCHSFSQWWTRATRGVQQAQALL